MMCEIVQAIQSALILSCKIGEICSMIGLSMSFVLVLKTWSIVQEEANWKYLDFS